MSSDRANLAGVVVLTTCLTSVVLVGGWFVVTRYLGQQTVSAAREDVVPPPPPPKKTARPQRGEAVATAPHDNATASGRAEAAQDDVRNAAAPSQKDAEPSSAADDATTPAPAKADPDAPRPRVESDSPGPAPEAGRPVAAVDAHDARSVMEEVQRRSEATFYRYDGLLQSFDGKGRITEKRWTFDREGSHGQSKAVLRFTAPAEVKGVALLIVNHPERASDQWMWTPAIERDRRISLQDRSTRFFGTDFSFEDLEERDVDQYDYSMLGSEVVDGSMCWKIQQTPKASRSSQYTRAVAWIRQDNYAYARLDNFVKDEIVRRLSSTNIENIQGIWTARQIDVVDLRRGTKTRLGLQQVKYNAPMKDDDFTLQAIRR